MTNTQLETQLLQDEPIDLQKPDMSKALEYVLNNLKPLYDEPLVLDTINWSILYWTPGAGELYVGRVVHEPWFSGFLEDKLYDERHRIIVRTDEYNYKDELIYARDVKPEVLSVIQQSLDTYSTEHNKRNISLVIENEHFAPVVFGNTRTVLNLKN